jgi:tubulysin polyketide synthase-like protein
VSADLILREVRGRGVELKVVGNELLYRPRGALTEDLRAALSKHKSALMNLLARERRDPKEADRRGLVIRWSQYPDWIELRDPVTGQWHEVRAAECLPGVVETANRLRSKKVQRTDEVSERSS